VTGGRSLLRSLFWFAAVGAWWLVLQTGSPPGGAQASYSSVVTVGIDAVPGATPANTGNTLGSIESCRSVNNGATFTVDFWVKDIPSPGIEGFQGDLNYDPARLNVTWYNVTVYAEPPPPSPTPTPTPTATPTPPLYLLLAYNYEHSVQDFTRTAVGQPDHIPDADGKFTPAAYDWGTAQGHSETGSGVLARITFHAIANGTSQLTLTKVKLSDPAGNAIGDTNDDYIFDGPISNAEIRIGEPCPTATPTPTRTPTPTATPTRTPGTGPPVGGIAELPALAETSADEVGVPAKGSGWSAGDYAALGGGVAAAAAAGCVWYARRQRAR